MNAHIAITDLAENLTEAEQLAAWVERGKSAIFMVQVNVGPSLAALLLARNLANRIMVTKGAVRCVASYAAAMKRGEWVLNGETLVLSSTGELNDGQHRLHAIIKAGVPAPMLIVFGIERETRHTVDQGVGRTPGHILSMYGEKNTNQLATALQFTWAMDNDASLHSRPSTDELLATLDRHPDIRDRLRDVSHLTQLFRASPGYIAGAHYLCLTYDAPKAERFLEIATTGVGIESTHDPIARFRTMLVDHYAKRTKRSAIEQAANYVKAFNAHVREKPRLIIWRETGNEPFPAPGYIA
jgi:hypothetical protein